MRRRRLFEFGLICVLAAAAVGCGGSDSASSDLPPAQAGSDDGVFADTGVVGLTFEAGAEVALVAGESHVLYVQVQPAGRHTVRFAVLQAMDGGAFLSDDVVETRDDGSAETRLTVLSATSPFTIRAAAGRVESTLRVVPIEAAVATLLVTPKYGGDRAAGRWSASVHVDQTCAGLQGVPYPDGTHLATTTAPPVQLEGVPANRPLAVVVRAEQFAGGCRGLSPLLANSRTEIEIEVFDRPMQISDLDLGLGFSVEAAEELHPALKELAFRAASALTSGGTDLGAVLDTMGTLSDDPTAFELARASQGWVALLATSLTEQVASTGLRAKVQSLMHEGLWGLYQQSALAGRLHSTAATGEASLTLASVIGLPPDRVGFAVENAASVAAETEDYLRIGTTLSFQPSLLLSEAATLAAIAENPVRTSASDALASEFDCARIGAQLVDAGTLPGEAFPGCDADCVRELCESAMGVLWARVQGSNLGSVPWQFSGAARASVDENARPVRVSGTWVGSLTVPDFPEPPGPVAIQGPFIGDD